MALDWMTQAAKEISLTPDQIGWICEVIFKHCPFKEGVACMPVPRCETCKHWNKNKVADFDTRPANTCDILTEDFIDTASWGDFYVITPPDFGCVQWEAK